MREGMTRLPKSSRRPFSGWTLLGKVWDSPSRRRLMLKKVSTRKITLRKEIYQYLLYEAFTEEP